MKIYDCTLFYDENMILELRLNMLNKHVDKFVISESMFTHSGEKKKLNFNINNFSEFKKKIIYIPVKNEPEDLEYDNENGKLLEKPSNRRINSVKRIAHQRNKLMDGLSEADDSDFIFYSDNDEMPNFNNFNFKINKNKIVMFKQKLFYYKFNLLCDLVDWYGTKGCTKKNLISFEWLRQIKPKKYPFFRFDTIFSKVKYNNVNIVDDGGWHFTRILTPEEIHLKELNAEHHDEYRLSKKDVPMIKDLVERKVINYDFSAKSTDNKFTKEFKLKTLSIDHMPLFLKENINKYSKWFDFENK